MKQLGTDASFAGVDTAAAASVTAFYKAVPNSGQALQAWYVTLLILPDLLFYDLLGLSLAPSYPVFSFAGLNKTINALNPGTN